jgi:Fe-S-cluster-containing hydrogenase component 2
MLTVDRHICLDCTGCVGICPEMALYFDLDGLDVDDGLCTACGLCVEFCPVLALTLAGDKTEVGV